MSDTFNDKLDEILTELCKNTQVDYGYEKLVPIETDEAKQAIRSLINSEVKAVLEELEKQEELLYDSYKDAPFYAVPILSIQSIKERYKL